MTEDRDIANYAAIILGSMMGPTLAFGIPVALGIIEKKDTKYLALGTLAGVIVIPFACVVGGLIAGFGVQMILVNMIPIFLVAILIAIGLALIPNGMIKGFNVFSKIMIAIITISLAHAIVSELTGITIIKGMAPLADSYVIIGSIAIMLAGAYPMVFVITKLAAKPLAKIGKVIGVNDVSVAGLIATLANSIPTYGMIKDMDTKGKVVNFAFICCAAFALGDHLGFCAGVEPDLIFPMVACKVIGGIICIFAALFLCRLQGSKLEENPA
jgi:ethanolamine transporter